MKRAVQRPVPPVRTDEAAVPYRFDPRADDSIRVERIPNPLRVRYHYHDEYEVVCAPAGSGRWIVGDAAETCATAQVLLVGPRVAHAWVPESLPPRRRPRRAAPIVITFTELDIGMDLLARPLFAPIRDMLARTARGLVLRGAPAAALAPAVERVAAAGSCERFVRFLELLRLLAAETRLAPVLTSPARLSHRENDHRAFAALIQHIHRHASERIALPDAARCAGMGVSAFAAFFKRMTGATFVTYLNRWRVDRACLLLRTTDASVADVAFTVGFGNLSNFNRQFLRLRGMSPRAFRAAADRP